MATDKEILDLYNAGKTDEAFKQLVHLYSERLYWHIRRFVLSHDEANDILQEVYIKIWKSLSSFRGDSGLYTWVYRIATNESLNYLRKKKKKATLSFGSFSELMDKKIDEDVFFNGNEIQRELHRAIQKLPNKQKVVFNLRYFDELSYKEISEILNTSEGALKASYHHAYKKIKEELQKKF